ncbi:MAG: LysR family transcriptional regulator [Alphaproteobacteria bacterium]|nr:LysR family transcriptional regulator [Alphaproteobacteria bacterium]
MGFRSYDGLRLFDVVARHLSFTAAANELNLTKGAISYQIGRLEGELGFRVFERRPRGIVLTEKGRKLWQASHAAFRDLDREIAALKGEGPGRITIGMSTYFASRWLSPRLMTFIADNPRIGLRLQPLIDLIDLRTQGIDMAIRWGKGDWTDMVIEPLLACPAFPVAGITIATRVGEIGLEAALEDLILLHDRDGSLAWRDWHAAAGLTYRSRRNDLVVPDPNVRVQAVIDGQGIALNDRLVAAELAAGQLLQVSAVELPAYGYHLAYPKGALGDRDLGAFRDWIVTAARSDHDGGPSM